MEAAATVGNHTAGFPPRLGKRSAFPTAPTALCFSVSIRRRTQTSILSTGHAMGTPGGNAFEKQGSHGAESRQPDAADEVRAWQGGARPSQLIHVRWTHRCSHRPACGKLAGEGDQVKFQVELEQEDDGRWIAEVRELPGVLAYGASSSEAQARVQALALRVVADRLEHGEAGSELVDISFNAA